MSWCQLRPGSFWSDPVLFILHNQDTVYGISFASVLLGQFHAICQDAAIFCFQISAGANINVSAGKALAVIASHLGLWMLCTVRLATIDKEEDNLHRKTPRKSWHQYLCRSMAIVVYLQFVILQLDCFQVVIGFRWPLRFTTTFWLPLTFAGMLASAFKCYCDDVASTRWSMLGFHADRTLANNEPYSDFESSDMSAPLQRFPEDLQEDEQPQGPLAAEVQRRILYFRSLGLTDGRTLAAQSSHVTSVDAGTHEAPNTNLSGQPFHELETLDIEGEVSVPLPTTSSYWASFEKQDILVFLAFQILFRWWAMTAMMLTWNCLEPVWSWAFLPTIISFRSDLVTLAAPTVCAARGRSPANSLAISGTLSLFSTFVAIPILIVTTSVWTCGPPGSGTIVSRNIDPASDFTVMLMLCNVAVLLQLGHWVRTWTSSTAARDWLMLRVQHD